MILILTSGTYPYLNLTKTGFGVRLNAKEPIAVIVHRATWYTQTTANGVMAKSEQ